MSYTEGTKCPKCESEDNVVFSLFFGGKRKMDGKEFFGTEKVDTYYGTWDGINDWDTYTGERE